VRRISSTSDGDTVTAVVALSLAAVVTYLLRAGMTLNRMGSASAPEWSWMAFVAPAVLTAILTSALVLDHGELVRPPVAEPLAMLAALVGVRRTGNVSVALAVGFPVFWIVGAIG
jgi:branched-subunit amino acid transport protein